MKRLRLAWDWLVDQWDGMSGQRSRRNERRFAADAKSFSDGMRKVYRRIPVKRELVGNGRSSE